MKKHFIWSTLLASSILFSCEDETTTAAGEVNAEDAKAEINSLANQASQDITRLTESEGVNGALDLLQLLEEFDFNARKSDAEGVRDQLHTIAQYFVYGPSSRVSDDEPFSFADIKGLYEWNPETEAFDKSPSDFFIVRFPTEGSNSNDAELKISNLEFVTIVENFDGFVDEYQVPTRINGYLKIDEVEVIRLDFTAEWTDNGFPERADVVLLVSPFTFTIGFNNTFPLSSSLVTSVKLDNEVIIGMDVDVDFMTEEKEEPKFVEGFVQYYNLKISGSVDVPADGEDENVDINEFVNLVLLLDDEKIGDIVFEEDLAYVVYEDGSRELLEEILEPVIEEIEELFEEFEDE